jgi:hypothetical protein
MQLWLNRQHDTAHSETPCALDLTISSVSTAVFHLYGTGIVWLIAMSVSRVTLRLFGHCSIPVS